MTLTQTFEEISRDFRFKTSTKIFEKYGTLDRYEACLNAVKARDKVVLGKLPKCTSVCLKKTILHNTLKIGEQRNYQEIKNRMEATI